jgi:hypothetical protein
MTLKGFLREVEAAQRRAAREEIRQQRELERERKEIEKMEELERARYEVDVYEEQISDLLSVHKECCEVVNWRAINEGLPPAVPEKPDDHERVAQSLFDNYEASIADILFFRIRRKRQELYDAIDVGRAMDAEEYALQLMKFETFFKDWEWKRLRSDYVIAGDLEAMLEVIDVIGPFRQITGIGSSLEFNLENRSEIEVSLNVNGKEAIPAEVKTVLKTGKLSVKKMPVTRYNELYQDYICGCALRIARELFALLPFEKVFVHAVGDILNTKTGYKESQPILSVLFTRETIETLNFDDLDPSDCMENFVHNMDFKERSGFKIVERIQPQSFQGA